MPGDLIGDPKRYYTAPAALWSSPPLALDATLLCLHQIPPQVAAYKVAANLPLTGGTEPVWVISHPGGGGLQVSMKNNVLVGRQESRLHYRAATRGGSSGAPVFNNEWSLIGLHHAGGEVETALGAAGAAGPRVQRGDLGPVDHR